jgi:tetratricopeptide (TPR) repeat protein
MTNKNIELLNEANKLFLKKLFRDSLPIYDEILKSEPENIDVINNKGYALSKMKNYDEAILCYDKGLKINPTEKCLLINKISALRKKGKFDNALELCNLILKNDKSENVALYHKLRILYSMKKFTESINICDKLLGLYPNNGDVLFDKSCNYAALGETSSSMLNLKLAIGVSSKFKINAKKNNVFETLKEQETFLKLVK